MKRSLQVVGAAFIRDGKLLALRRAGGIDSVKHKYEFVGGKIEDGETPEEALRRECLEELSLQIIVGEKLSSVSYEYPEFTVNLGVYRCEMLSGYTLKEHEEEKWINLSALSPDEWAPADAEIIEIIKNSATF